MPSPVEMVEMVEANPYSFYIDRLVYI